jgi:hypothetical protein
MPMNGEESFSPDFNRRPRCPQCNQAFSRKFWFAFQGSRTNFEFFVAGQDSLCEGDISTDTFCFVLAQEHADEVVRESLALALGELS